ncbi:hypothetical protein LCGC14_0384120 [marine sediment metagenome]|uniref:Uncharacterized protein n=1 Tax=marine sediment metagenome TaxID=412755 RepID=A0A0F9WA88_9ZZZZ
MMDGKSIAELLGAGGILSFIGVIFRMQNKRTSELAEKTVLREGCKERHGTIDRRLAQGEDQFKTMTETQTAQGLLLVRIDERVTALALKNGITIKEG